MREAIDRRRLARRVSFRPTVSTDFPLYSRLLSLDDWRLSYGLEKRLSEQEKIDFSTKKYEGLRRFIICASKDSGEIDLGFLHIITIGEEAEISGGICPKFLNRGYGVCALARAIDLLCDENTVAEIKLTVEKNNIISKKMINAMGANITKHGHYRDIFRIFLK